MNPNRSFLTRWLVSLFFACFSFGAVAEVTTLDFASDAVYNKELGKVHEFPRYIEQVLSNRAMITMNGRDSAHPINALDLMSRVFISSKFGDADKSQKRNSRLVLALSGIKISSSLKYDAIYTHPKGYIIHVQAKDGDIALFFQGFGLELVNEIKQEIVRSKKVAELEDRMKSRSLLAGVLLPSAWAYEEAPALCGGPIHNSSSVGSTNASLLQKVWGCTKGAAGGVWDASAGAAWSVAKGTYNAVVHPFDTFNSASAAIRNVSAMMSDLQGTFGELQSAYEALPDDVKWKLGCEIVSAVGTTGLIAYFSAGAGSPLLIRTIAQAMAKIGSALPAGSATAVQTLALAEKMGSKASQMVEIQNMIAQGVDGKQFVDKVRRFDGVISDVNRTHTDLYFASRVPKVRGSGGWPASPIIDDLSERAAFDKAVKARDALQASDPDFMNAMYTADRAKKDFEMATDPAVRARILKELQASQKLSPAQKAAAVAYLGAQGCNLSGQINDTLNGGSEDKPATAN